MKKTPDIILEEEVDRIRYRDTPTTSKSFSEPPEESRQIEGADYRLGNLIYGDSQYGSVWGTVVDMKIVNGEIRYLVETEFNAYYWVDPIDEYYG